MARQIAYAVASSAFCSRDRRPSTASARAMCRVPAGKRKAAASSTSLSGRMTAGVLVRRSTMMATHQTTRYAHSTPNTSAPRLWRVQLAQDVRRPIRVIGDDDVPSIGCVVQVREAPRILALFDHSKRPAPHRFAADHLQGKVACLGVVDERAVRNGLGCDPANLKRQD